MRDVPRRYSIIIQGGPLYRTILGSRMTGNADSSQYLLMRGGRTIVLLHLSDDIAPIIISRA